MVGLLAVAGGATAATVTEFSAGISPGSYPDGITAGPDGNLWFTERDGDRIGRITPAGTVTEFSANITPGNLPGDITAGPDGNLWFTEFTGGRIGRITPAGTVTEFTVAGVGDRLSGITAGPDGNLWYTIQGGRIGRITPAGTFTEFTVGIGAGTSPDKITAGPDGNLWFTANGGSRVGRITPAGAITVFNTGIGANTESDIVTGPDRNLWFTAGDFGGRIGRITPSGAVTQFRTPLGTLPGIAAGPEGNLWVASMGEAIARVTPGGAVNVFRAGISPGSSPRGIAAGPDGNLWFTESGGDRIGRITTDVPPAVVPRPALTLPKPVLGKLVNVRVVRGRVFVSVPRGAARVSASVPGIKGRKFVPLRGALQIPVGSLLDTRKGTVRLTSARNGTGATQSADFLSGVFQVRQSGRRIAKGLTELRLKGASFRGCNSSRLRSRRRGRFRTPGRVQTPTVRGGRAAAARRSRRTIRRLRGRGSGRFRTRGRHSAATVRGTDWTVRDRCDGTLTTVKRGKVAVRDFRRKKTISVRAGKRYLARAPN